MDHASPTDRLNAREIEETLARLEKKQAEEACGKA